MKLTPWEPFGWPRRLGLRFPLLWDEGDWPEIHQQGLTVYETDDDLVVKANVAGVPAEDVDVSVENNVVTIKAKHEESKEEKEKKRVVYREAKAAHYFYTAAAPCPVLADKAKAVVADGVVTVTIPKAPQAKPKKIKVTAKSK